MSFKRISWRAPKARMRKYDKMVFSHVTFGLRKPIEQSRNETDIALLLTKNGAFSCFIPRQHASGQK